MAFGANLMRRLGLTRADPASSDVGWFGSWFGAKSATGIEISQQTALMAPVVMACISILAEDVAKMRPQIFRRKLDGGRDVAKDQPLYRLLRRPNDWQTWFEFAMQMICGLALRGNAYAVILRNMRGDPIMWVPLNPDYVSLWQAPTGELFWMVTRTGYHMLAVLRNVPLMVPYEDVMHWKGISGNGLVGISKIAMNREAIGLSLALEQMSARMAGNGSKASGVLSTEQKLTPDAAKRLKDDWKKVTAGILNTGQTAVLEQGLKWTPFTLNMADLEFIASRNFQVEDVARLWRVPPHMVGILSRSTGTTLVQQSQEYLNYTLMTYKQIIEQRFEFTFNLEDDLFVELDVNRLLQADILSRYNAYRFGIQGWLTANEIRIAEGLDPNPDPRANELFRPVNMAPISSDVFLGQDVLGPDDPGLGSEVGGDNGPGAGRPDNDSSNPDQAPQD